MRSVTTFFAATTFAVTVSFLAACSGGAATTTSSGSSSTSSASVEATLASIQTNVFTPSCATGGCHDATTRASGLDLSSAAVSCAGLVGVAATESSSTGRECTQGGAISSFVARVTAGNAQASFLSDKISGGTECVTIGGIQAGERMPKDMTPLGAVAIAAIEEWITAGASCN